MGAGREGRGVVVGFLGLLVSKPFLVFYFVLFCFLSFLLQISWLVW